MKRLILILALIASSALAEDYILVLVKTNSALADKSKITNHVTIITGDSIPEALTDHPEWRSKTDTNDIRWLYCMDSSIVTTQKIAAWAALNLTQPLKLSAFLSNDPAKTLDKNGFEPVPKGGTLP